MKTKTAYLILFALALTACAAPATPAPTATATLTETPTLIPTQTETPTATVTATEIPASAESDLHPAYTETITDELLGVKITTKLITDKSLDPTITAIKINPNFHNSEGKNSEEALTEFTARTIYKVWLKKGGPDGTGPTTETTFDDFMLV